MEIRKLVLSTLGVVALVGLSGCAHYRARPLRPLRAAQGTQEQTISLDYEVFNAYDCKRYLDRNTLAQGYQPIQITFVNNTDHHFIVSPQGFSFGCASSREVANTVHTNTVGRAVGYGVAGLFIWPFIIPAIVDGLGSSRANEELDADFAHKTLRGQTVKPYGTANGIVFVGCDEFDGDFDMTVTDSANNENYVLGSATPMVKI